jgi:hypothetical protein
MAAYGRPARPEEHQTGSGGAARCRCPLRTLIRDPRVTIRIRDSHKDGAAREGMLKRLPSGVARFALCADLSNKHMLSAIAENEVPRQVITAWRADRTGGRFVTAMARPAAP